jgi:hypothetical protein
VRFRRMLIEVMLINQNSRATSLVLSRMRCPMDMNDIEVGPDGRADLYVAGGWPLNNLQMANALKTR